MLQIENSITNPWQNCDCGMIMMFYILDALYLILLFFPVFVGN